MDGNDPPFRWAVLGTGVVSRKFALGLRALPGAGRVEIVASRDAGRAERLAASVGAPRTATYARAVADPGVDAVYVATPPSEHEAHALLALSAGRPVLVEKPFAMDGASARRIADQARSSGIFCMEAMWTRFLPLMAQVRRRIASGTLGELRGLDGCFTGNDRVDPSSSLFDPARGGGALMHRGVYALSLARHLVGPVASLTAVGWIGATGVDEDCALVLSHEGGAVSTARAGLRAAGTNDATLYGTRATLRIEPPIYRPSSARVLTEPPRATGDPRGGSPRWIELRESRLAQGLHQRLGPGGLGGARPGRRIVARYTGNGYGHQARAVADAVAGGLLEHPVMPLAESVEIMDLVDRARACWGRGVRDR